MGHCNNKSTPDTRPWRRVIAHLAEGDSAAIVAQATTRAALGALVRAGQDPGIARAVFLLARIPMAARQERFADNLAALLVPVPDDPTLADLTAGVSQAIQSWHDDKRIPRTDLGEMAELALNEALTRCVGDRSGSLFPVAAGVQLGIRFFSTPPRFASLAHEFFARFTQRFLLYHLDRELSHHVGGNGRFPDRAARRAFTDDFAVHCREAAEIVRDYARDWYAKAKHEDGISVTRAGRFAFVCMKKLRAELLVRGEVEHV